MYARKISLHAIIFLALALTGIAMFWSVLDTGFWSPEDFSALSGAAEASASGDTTPAFRPAFSGGYPVNPIFSLEFRLFGFHARPYLMMNLFVHILNACLAFLLVNNLLHDRKSSFLAALLFVLTVGSYGKNLMFASGISSLLYASTVLLAILLYVYNEKYFAGRFLSPVALGFM